MAVRVAAGLAMTSLLAAVVSRGHLAVCTLVAAVQCAIFGELVNLRFTAAKSKAVEGPLFRTVQWGWFATAMAHSYGSSWLKAPLGGHAFLAELNAWCSTTAPATNGVGTSPEAVVNAAALGMYSLMLVVTVLSLQPGLYTQQVGQLSWTGLILIAVVFQLKVAVYSIYSGLYFFLFPASLVVANDSFAYFCGMACGKRLVSRPFLALSPNKTWEGFVGALVLTVAYAYLTANMWAAAPWMRCSFPEVSQRFRGLGGTGCASDTYFEVAAANTSADADADMLAATSRAQAVGVALALFASLIAPFGGFFASAVKRATGVKDFAGYIPGHGGLTDRMDCQLIMAVAAPAVFALCMPHPSSPNM